MNTFLLLLANITATIALPAMSITSAECFAMLAVLAILIFAAIDYGALKPRRRRKPSVFAAQP